jgi:histidine phosphotransferase ChpT
MLIDVRLLEMLASKVCHDLISPVGAINNGVELIEDIGGSVVNDAMKLINDSAQQAAKRLRLFRMAYGKAGAENGVTLKDIRTTARDHLKGSKITIDWADAHALDPFVEQRGGLKVLLNTLMMAEDSLSHGGHIVVEPGTESSIASITATGTHARLSDAILAALRGETDMDEITPRTVHACVLGQFAKYYGLQIETQQHSEERLIVLIHTKAAAAAESPVEETAVSLVSEQPEPAEPRKEVSSFYQSLVNQNNTRQKG